jgi:UDP:flavonoid glycosyltransferase YjiC (YdhE family)
MSTSASAVPQQRAESQVHFRSRVLVRRTARGVPARISTHIVKLAGVRVLVSSTAGAGHFNPLLPVLQALERRNDDVPVVVPPELEARVRATGHTFLIGADPPKDELDPLWASFTALSRAEVSVIVEREIFGRLCTAAMLPAVDEACRDWRPDLVLHETCEYSSVIAAERCGVSHAQVAISAAAAEAGAQGLAAPSLEPYAATLSDRLYASPYLTRFPTSMDPSPFPNTLRYRDGPKGDLVPLPDWWAGSDLPLVYVTFGSVTGGLSLAKATYQVALQAVAGLAARVLFTIGRKLDSRRLGPCRLTSTLRLGYRRSRFSPTRPWWFVTVAPVPPSPHLRLVFRSCSSHYSPTSPPTPSA